MEVNPLLMVLSCQALAPILALDLPKVDPLYVTAVARLPRGPSRSFYDHVLLDTPIEMPDRLIIRGTIGRGPKRREWKVGIDLEAGVVGAADWSVLASVAAGTSGDLGVMLLGSPGILLASPIILATHGLYGLARLASGMDHHTWSAWLRMSPSLPSEHHDVVHQAFVNHCNGVEAAYNVRLHAARVDQERQARLEASFDRRKDSIFDGAFMVRYAAGCAEPEDVFADLRDWEHRQPIDSHVRLHDWLGMTPRELDDWRGQRLDIDEILQARRTASMSPVTDEKQAS